MRAFLGPYVREQVGGVNAANIVIIVFPRIILRGGSCVGVYSHLTCFT